MIKIYMDNLGVHKRRYHVRLRASCRHLGEITYEMMLEVVIKFSRVKKCEAQLKEDGRI